MTDIDVGFIRADDVFPVRALPGLAENWGRTVEDRIRALERGDSVISLSVSNTQRSLSSQLEYASQIAQDAALASETADGKNSIFASVSEPVAPSVGFAQGDLWYVLNGSGQFTGVRVWNGVSFVPYMFVADSVVVPGSVGPTVIKDGAVTTVKLDAGAVTAGKIAANAVTAGKIAANAVTAAKISATAIDGKTITGATIRTAASGQRVQLDINGLRTFDSAGVETTRLSASGSGLLLKSMVDSNIFNQIVLDGNGVSVGTYWNAGAQGWRANLSGTYLSLSNGVGGQEATIASGNGTGKLQLLAQGDRISLGLQNISSGTAGIELFSPVVNIEQGKLSIGTSGGSSNTSEPSVSLLRRFDGQNRTGKIYIPADTSPNASIGALLQIEGNSYSRFRVFANGQASIRTYASSPTATGTRPLPFAIHTGRVSKGNVASGGVSNTTVTFPAGRFTKAPHVTATVWGDARDTTVNIDSVSSTSFVLRRGNVSIVSRNIGAHWQAIQLTV